MKYLIPYALLLISLSSVCSAAQPPALEKIDQQFFIENKGQWPEEVLFRAKLNGLDAWITRGGAVYDFFFLERNGCGAPPRSGPFAGSVSPKEHRRYGQVVRMTLTGALTAATAQGTVKAAGHHHYFLGSDPSKWASNVALYRDAWVKNVYAGIDLHYYFEEGKLRYDYVLAPDADASQIGMQLQDADHPPAVDGQGALTFATRFGTVKHADLFAYQMVSGVRKPVEVRFVRSVDGQVRFTLGNYQRSLPLVIDPLISATYLGGTSDDVALGLVLDSAGNACVVGSTFSTDFATTAGGYQRQTGGGRDGFVAKLGAGGSALSYATYLGGTSEDEAKTVALDRANNLCVAGFTASADFPVTAGAYQSTRPSSGTVTDGFVTRLNAGGPLGVSESLRAPAAWTVFPNPVHGTFTIGCAQPAEFELTDVQGRMAGVHKAVERHTVVRADLAPGCYFLRNRESGGVVKVLVD